MIFDVSEADFETRVIERSRELPVIVDFWAEWCGPCRQLGPALESAVRARGGDIELAKLDVDSNQMLAQAFRIQGIPAVKAFRDARVAGEFTGAIPPAKIEEFIDGLLPSEADQLADAGDEESLRAALDRDPRHAGAAAALGRLLIARGEREEARTVLSGHEDSDFLAAGLLARLGLEQATDGNGGGPNALADAFTAWDEGRPADALEALQATIAAEPDPDRRDLLRRVMVAIFTELGPGDPLATEHRRRLAAALN
jgi:putative thioredoxin